MQRVTVALFAGLHFQLHIREAISKGRSCYPTGGAVLFRQNNISSGLKSSQQYALIGWYQNLPSRELYLKKERRSFNTHSTIYNTIYNTIHVRNNTKVDS